MKEKIYDLIIAGGGASGLMAASVSEARTILLLEKNPSVGRKILSTGAGKCNLSNEKIIPERYHCRNQGFAASVFKAAPPETVIGFFNSGLGLLTKKGESGKIFPYSEKAESVVRVFEKKIKKKGVETKTSLCVSSAVKKNGFFEVSCSAVRPPWLRGEFKEEKFVFFSKNLILACGGPAYPQIGGSSSGYGIARSFGHKLRDPKPAITPLLIREKEIKELSGVRCEAFLRFVPEKASGFHSAGEILFTDYGLSGPAALDASRKISDDYPEGLTLLADLFPDLPAGKLEKEILKKISAGFDSYEEAFSGMTDPKLEKYLLFRSGFSPNEKISPDSSDKIKKLVYVMKNLELRVSGVKDFSMAMTKTGGVSTKEIKPESFESKIVNGLYLTGEMLDIDGETGGYNLHFAWTSGFLAGQAAK